MGNNLSMLANGLRNQTVVSLVPNKTQPYSSSELLKPWLMDSIWYLDGSVHPVSRFLYSSSLGQIWTEGQFLLFRCSVGHPRSTQERNCMEMEQKASFLTRTTFSELSSCVSQCLCSSSMIFISWFVAVCHILLKKSKMDHRIWEGLCVWKTLNSTKCDLIRMRWKVGGTCLRKPVGFHKELTETQGSQRRMIC